MMLANDGHDVTVLERDPEPPPAPDAAWDDWERRGVNQFRMLHFFLARFRLGRRGRAARADRGDGSRRRAAHEPARGNSGRDHRRPARRRRAIRDRHGPPAGRRVGRRTTGRGHAGAHHSPRRRRRGLLTTPGADGIVHVTGVRTDDGEEITADLVVDSGGRRSAMTALAARRRGRPGPKEMIEDCRLRLLRPPLPFCRRVDPAGVRRAVAAVRFDLDPDAARRQRHLGRRRDHQLEGRALRGTEGRSTLGEGGAVVPDGRPLDRRRADHRRQADGQDRGPAPHVRRRRRAGRNRRRAVGDAWACTNPSLGRGISIGHRPRRSAARRCCARYRSTTRGARRCAGTN